MGCGSGKNNQAVSESSSSPFCLRGSCLPLSHRNYSSSISLFNKYPVLYELPAEGGRGVAGVSLGAQRKLVTWSGLWEWSWGEAGLGAAPAAVAEAGCPLLFVPRHRPALGIPFCFGIPFCPWNPAVGVRCALGIDASVLNASRFLSVPVPGGSVWPVARSAIPEHPAQGSRQR